MIERGQIVKALAGREKDRFYVVVSCEKDCVYLADGKERKLQKPKRKNTKHIAPTKTVLPTERMQTDAALRRELRMYEDPATAEDERRPV